MKNWIGRTGQMLIRILPNFKENLTHLKKEEIMNKRMIYPVFLVLTLLVFTVNFSLAAEKPVKVKYAHIGAPKTFDSAMHATAIGFKFVMEKRSSGRFQVDIYPAGTLGKELDLMEAVRNNVIQVNAASMGGLHRIFPPAVLFFAPYVFKNEAIAVEVIDGPFGQKLLDAFTEKTGIKGLAIGDIYSFMSITNNVRQIRKPADMKGIKFRAMDTLQVKMFKALGGSAVPVSFSELYTSLQTGVVQGQTNPAFLVAWMKLNEVQKYMTLANSQYGYQWLICNKGWYDKLSPEDKLIVQDAAKAATTASRGLSILLEDKNIAALKEKGMDVYALTEDEILEFQRLARPACLEWLKTQMDPKWVDGLMKAIKDAERKLGYGK
jgi:tripartite ATP-independent transporter DctP family solute receptor